MLSQEQINETLKNVVEFNLPRFAPKTNKEIAEEIHFVCINGGGTETCNLLTHFPNLEEEIFKYLEARLTCSRSACKILISEKHGYYKIWNEPSTEKGYREYCVPCGRRIMEYNLSCPSKEHMKYEIVRADKRKVFYG